MEFQLLRTCTSYALYEVKYSTDILHLEGAITQRSPRQLRKAARCMFWLRCACPGRDMHLHPVATLPAMPQRTCLALYGLLCPL